MDLDLPICKTCGVQYAGPREDCPVCLDERQYVGWDGQQWTTLARLTKDGHRGLVRAEGPGVIGIGADPPTAIGQRALLVRAPGGNVLFDMITYIDDDLIAQVRELGGISAIAISHPHFYGSMIEWAHAFDASVYIHEADRRWTARPDDAIVYWQGDTREIGDGLTLINAGVHFDGGQVLHWSGERGSGERGSGERGSGERGAGGQDGAGLLCSGDIMTVVPDRRYVSFMYSYPNLIPERPRTIRRALAMLDPFSFDRIYGAWWGRIVHADGKAALHRSAERYLSLARGVEVRPGREGTARDMNGRGGT
jgi:hypothetical protein